jgi:hypothetical protein
MQNRTQNRRGCGVEGVHIHLNLQRVKVDVDLERARKTWRSEVPRESTMGRAHQRSASGVIWTKRWVPTDATVIVEAGVTQ